MCVRDLPRTVMETGLDKAKFQKDAHVCPGYINHGSHLHLFDSLSARLRAEIDTRIFTSWKSAGRDGRAHSRKSIQNSEQ